MPIRLVSINEQNEQNEQNGLNDLMPEVSNAAEDQRDFILIAGLDYFCVGN